jgi:ABC-2 type transport system ATP-binding protein
MDEIIRTVDLSRTFDVKKKKRFAKRTKFVALDSVNLEIKEGELFGLLGPNGAGKTTVIKILCTLLLPTSGHAYVGGYDVVKEPHKVRMLINMVSGGETSGYGILTVRENLWLFSQLYGMDSKVAHKRIDEILEVVGLSDKADTRMNRISTGMRQMLNVARGFICSPRVLFMDEPTLGLDVNIARRIRSYIKEWLHAENDRTILVTTHYMAEADELCDRVAIIDEGRILECDSPANLKRRVSTEDVLELEVGYLPDVSFVSSIKGVKRVVSKQNEEKGTTDLRFHIEDDSVISDVLSALDGKGSKVVMLKKTEPTLEDVFVKLVGRGLE